MISIPDCLITAWTSSFHRIFQETARLVPGTKVMAPPNHPRIVGFRPEPRVDVGVYESSNPGIYFLHMFFWENNIWYNKTVEYHKWLKRWNNDVLKSVVQFSFACYISLLEASEWQNDTKWFISQCISILSSQAKKQ